MPKKQLLSFPITENYSPRVPVEVLGSVHGNVKEVVAIVDTGFTGFMQIPLAIGIACNLNLWGIQSFKLADGKLIKNIECFGKIRFAGKELFGNITLSETSEDCLIGMQFLQELKMDFCVSVKDKVATFQDKPSTSKPAVPDVLSLATNIQPK